MDGKAVRESQITMTVAMNPEDANPVGNVHGGVVMKHVDGSGSRGNSSCPKDCGYCLN